MTLTGQTILLVEDEAFIAMDLEDRLIAEGATVLGPMATLDDAKRAAREGTFDAAILDIMLGRDEVFPAADILVERGIPFVFHSAHAEPARIQRAYPGVSLFPKPGDAQAMLSGLSKMTGA